MKIAVRDGFGNRRAVGLGKSITLVDLSSPLSGDAKAIALGNTVARRRETLWGESRIGGELRKISPEVHTSYADNRTKVPRRSV